MGSSQLNHAHRWLVGAAIVIALVAAGLLVLALTVHTTTAMTHVAAKSAGLPPDTLTSTRQAVTPSMAGGVGIVAVVVLLCAAFYGRITKLVLPGGVEVDLGTQQAAAAAAAKKGGDADAVKKNFTTALAHLAAASPDERKSLVNDPERLASLL